MKNCTKGITCVNRHMTPNSTSNTSGNLKFHILFTCPSMDIPLIGSFA
ncbi:hypothetical protein DsansV1_C35g0228021 [Dioscorea sansibarensis]